MDQGTVLNAALVLLFVLIGGVFAGTELALVSLRQSQLSRLEQQGRRGARVAAVARNPNSFLAAVQIGVTVAGFFSAAYGASTLTPDFVPALVGLGLSERVAQPLALVALTLVIANLSLVLGELVPKTSPSSPSLSSSWSRSTLRALSALKGPATASIASASTSAAVASTRSASTAGPSSGDHSRPGAVHRPPALVGSPGARWSTAVPGES